MSDTPHVSVVVPFYGSERHIAECIDSLLTQEDVGGPFEVVFVDNGSQDGSAAIVSRYPELVVVRETTPGAYAARNAGVRVARAPLIAFTDADCAVGRRWLRSIREGMEDPGSAILLGTCLYPYEASLPLRLLGAYENAKSRYVLERCSPAYRFAYANNMAVRASVFEEVGPFREWRRAGDTELVHRLTSRRPDLRVVYRPSMRIIHREFLNARHRLGRLTVYTKTNEKIGTFRELGLRQRFGVLVTLLRSLLAGGLKRVKRSAL